MFETDGNREAYPRFLKQYTNKRGLLIWTYCLMTNHVHLVAVPQREESLGLALRVNLSPQEGGRPRKKGNP